MNSFGSRLRAFLYIVSIGSLAFYFISLVNHQPEWILLVIGLSFFAGGYLLRRKNPPPVDSGRFGIIRRFSRRKEEPKDEE